ncbi:acyltransferase [Pelosinus sp. UFO1]|uniref:acyltransferase family protein n=1 Tax=Pelosinus sp. UFO1 TaxID=484770 RepID=UPI0004D0C902|nr:acyltransferase [Pelosinus sp. UFO1]AIF51814.1 acyltransferase 3 [Pelosinus sp. UFO1]
MRCIVIATRIHQLDALRGLASFSVVLHHCLLVFPLFLAANFHEGIIPIVSFLTYSPLHLFWAGHEAVILFFILSGFVLSLPYFQENQQKYFKYIIKRIFRIYIPYVVSLIISALLLQILSEHGIVSLSKWFNAMWKSIPDFAGWLGLLLMVSTDETHNINTVTWSLVYEMQVSIIFPLLVYLVKKANWRIVLCISILLIFHKSHLVHFSSFFIMGCLLAKYHYSISSYIANSKKAMNFTFSIVGLIFYLFEWLIPFNLSHNVLDLLTGIGASIFIALSLGDDKVKGFLLKPKLIYLGKISYSLYLVHPIVLLTAIYSLKDFFPIYAIVAMVPLISIVVAHFYNKFIENPAIALGRNFIRSKYVDLDIYRECVKGSAKKIEE